MSETADKNTFAGALAQESSHYVTLSNCTIHLWFCQLFFTGFYKNTQVIVAVQLFRWPYCFTLKRTSALWSLAFAIL